MTKKQDKISYERNNQFKSFLKIMTIQIFFKNHGKELKYDINEYIDYNYIHITFDKNFIIESLNSIFKFILENFLKMTKK